MLYFELQTWTVNTHDAAMTFSVPIYSGRLILIITLKLKFDW